MNKKKTAKQTNEIFLIKQIADVQKLERNKKKQKQVTINSQLGYMHG